MRSVGPTYGLFLLKTLYSSHILGVIIGLFGISRGKILYHVRFQIITWYNLTLLLSITPIDKHQLRLYNHI